MGSIATARPANLPTASEVPATAAVQRNSRRGSIDHLLGISRFGGNNHQGSRNQPLIILDGRQRCVSRGMLRENLSHSKRGAAMVVRRLFVMPWTVVLLTACVARAEDQFFDSSGVKIHYVVEGSGEPVLLIHGFTIDLERQWRTPGVIAALAKDHKVIAYDDRGHGKSDKPHEPKQYGLQMIEDAARLLDHLQIKRAHVVGYSMGATITNNLLTVHPDRVISATLGGAAAKLEGDNEPSFDEQFAEDIESGRGITRLAQFLTPPGRPLPTEEQLKVVNAGFYSRNDAKALAAVIRGLRDLNVAEAKAKANQVPVLALIGSLDPLTGRVEKMGTKLTGMSTVIIEGADHMNTPGRPEFAKELLGFPDKYKSN